MISLPLSPEIEEQVAHLSEHEKKSLSELIQAFVVKPKRSIAEIMKETARYEDSLSTIALPGPALTPEEGEKLAAEMDVDTDLLSEKEAVAHLAQLKSAWSKSSQ